VPPAASTSDPGGSPAGTAVFQVGALALINLIVLGGVAGLLQLYSNGQSIPTWFVVPEVSIVVIGGLTCIITFLVQGVGILVDDVVADDEEVARRLRSEPAGFAAWWLRNRNPFLKVVMIVLSLAMLFALDRLVHETGGGIDSPFAALLTAPAIFGPFLARTWKGIILSVVAVGTAVIYEVQVAPKEATASLNDHSRWVYGAVALAMIVLAGMISAAQRWSAAKRKQRLKAEVEAQGVSEASREGEIDTLDAVGENLDVVSVTEPAPDDVSDGTWVEITRDTGVEQRWPDGTVDTYGSFVSYRCLGGPFDRVQLALGTVSAGGKEDEVVGFVLGSGGGSKRPLTVFFPADDFDNSGERLSMIRGRNGTRKGFPPHRALPAAYDSFSVAILGDRISGKWNVKAVVAKSDESGVQTMLNHTAIQARLRGLI
jgi:hypothetical protein